MQGQIEDFKPIEANIRHAHVERSAYLGVKLGNALAEVWLSLSAMIEGAKAGMDEHRRRRVVAAAHAAHIVHH